MNNDRRLRLDPAKYVTAAWHHVWQTLLFSGAPIPQVILLCTASASSRLTDERDSAQARLLIVAPNMDAVGGEGGLDEKVVEIIDAAREGETPVVFALSK